MLMSLIPIIFVFQLIDCMLRLETVVSCPVIGFTILTVSFKITWKRKCNQLYILNPYLLILV